MNKINKKTEINGYGNLTVENIEYFINNQIERAERQVERFASAPQDDAFHAHLLHEALLNRITLVDFKRLLSHHDLNLECLKKPEDKRGRYD